MASYTLRTPPRVAHTKPPGPTAECSIYLQCMVWDGNICQAKLVLPFLIKQTFMPQILHLSAFGRLACVRNIFFPSSSFYAILLKTPLENPPDILACMTIDDGKK